MSPNIYSFPSSSTHKKSGKVAETGAISVGVKVSDGSLKNGRKWKSVDIGGFRCENIAKCFPAVSPNRRGMGKQSTNNR